MKRFGEAQAVGATLRAEALVQATGWIRCIQRSLHCSSGKRAAPWKPLRMPQSRGFVRTLLFTLSRCSWVCGRTVIGSHDRFSFPIEADKLQCLSVDSVLIPQWRSPERRPSLHPDCRAVRCGAEGLHAMSPRALDSMPVACSFAKP